MNRSISVVTYWFCLVITMVFCALVVAAGYYTKDQLVPFYMQRPLINGFILFVGLVGLFLSFFELLRSIADAHHLRKIFRPSATDSRTSQPQHDNRPEGGGAVDKSPDHRAPTLQDIRARTGGVGSGMVTQRLQSILALSEKRPKSAEELSLVLSQADTQSVDNRGIVVSYLLGVMVFLGLLGTFWGLLITVQGVNDVLGTLDPEQIDDPTAFLEQLKNSMGGMLGGMATAFSTSLFGLGGSLILGFAEMTARRSRSQLLVDLDRAVANNIIPLMGEDTERAELNFERIAKNTDSLPGVARYVSAHGREVTDSINKIVGLLGAPRDSVAQLEGIKDIISESANEMHNAGEKLGNIAQSLDRPITAFQEGADSLYQEISETRNAIETLTDRINDSMAPLAEVASQVSAVFEDNKQLRDRMDLVYDLGLDKLQEELDRRRQSRAVSQRSPGDSLMPTEPEDQE